MIDVEGFSPRTLEVAQYVKTRWPEKRLKVIKMMADGFEVRLVKPDERVSVGWHQLAEKGGS